jgi:HEAT repeat protein
MVRKKHPAGKKPKKKKGRKKALKEKPRTKEEMQRIVRQRLIKHFGQELLAQAKHKDPEVREGVAASLGQLGNVKALPLLETMMDDPNPHVQLAVVEAIRSIRSKAGIGLLEKKLNARVPLVRLRAAAGLWDLNAKQSAALLKKMIDTEKNSDVRSSVIRSFFRVASPQKSIPVFKKLMQSKSNSDRHLATAYLYSVFWKKKHSGPEKYLPLFRKMVNDSYYSVRQQAISFLGDYGTQKDLALIVEVRKKEPNAVVRAKADAALDVITSRLGVPRLYAEMLADRVFFDKEQIIARREQLKTGPRSLLLGGKLLGKAIIRIMPEQGLKAWKRAFNSKYAWKQAGFNYIPVEPILSKGNKERIYAEKKREELTGNYRVSTKVLGESLHGFLAQPKNQKHKEYLEAQRRKITDVLDSLGVNHYHLHAGNFCVEKVKKKGRPELRLYVIDFDLASLGKKRK